MDGDFDILAEKVADYIGAVQPQLDKMEELDRLEKAARATADANARFVGRATEALKSLARAGLVSENDVTPFVEKVADDHSIAWDFVEKAAAAASVAVPDLGHRSEETIVTSDADPWLREFGGSTSNAGNGMVD